MNLLTLQSNGKEVSTEEKCGEAVYIDGKVNLLNLHNHGKAVLTKEKCGKVV